MSDSCDLMDSSLPSSSIHGILQARILELIAISFSRESSRPRNRTWVSCIVGRFFTDWAMREALDSVLKNRDITLPTKVHIVKVMIFPVALYRCESWAIKKARHWGIDTFELWCWKRLLRVTWTARRANQLILKEINLEYLLEGLMPKLKLQYFGHLFQRANSLEKTWCWERLRAGSEGGNRGGDSWMSSLTQWTWVSANSGR